MSIYRRVLKYYRGFLGRSLGALVFSFAATGLNLLKPWPLKIIVDWVIPRFQQGAHVRWPTGPSWIQDPRMVVLGLCLALVLVQVLWGVCNYVSNYLFVKIGLQALLDLRTELYA